MNGQDNVSVSLKVGPDMIPANALTVAAKSEPGDCNNYHHVGRADLRATALEDRTLHGTVRLSAPDDSACLSVPLAWSGGQFLLRLSTRHVGGAGPRLCIWEDGPERCAKTDQPPSTPDWNVFSAAVRPDPGTRSIRLFLYADGDPSGPITTNDYGNVRAYALPETRTVALLGMPVRPTQERQHFVVQDVAYSQHWNSPGSGPSHVLVDGMFDGWLNTRGNLLPVYGPQRTLQVAQVISLLVGFVIACTATVGGWRKARAYRAGRRSRTVAVMQ